MKDIKIKKKEKVESNLKKIRIFQGIKVMEKMMVEKKKKMMRY